MGYGDMKPGNTDQFDFPKIVKFGVGGVLALMVFLVVVFGSVYTIDQGELGVITRNGAVSSVADSGLHFKVPFIDNVNRISMHGVARIYEKVQCYSRDQQVADLKISVNYKVKPGSVKEVYSNFGTATQLVERVLDRRVYDEVKNVFGKYTAISAIQDRRNLVTDINVAIKKSVLDIGGMLDVESVQIENIDFSKAYEDAVEARMKAEVEVAKIQQNLEAEKVSAQIKVTQAKGEADSNVATATAEAQAIKMRGDAEAAAINAKGRALRDNPDLVSLISAEKWDGKLPTTMVPNSAVPFVNVNHK